MDHLRELNQCLTMLYPERDDFSALLASLDDLVREEILPTAGRIDREGIYPRENLRLLARKGVMAIPFPPEWGGSGLPYPLYAGVMELLAGGCANTALQVSIQGMVCEGIRLFGSTAQKRLFLAEKGMTAGNHLAAFALTEPCCGSDAKAIRTRARLTGGSYVLDGIKTLITSPGEADLIVVFAATDAGISAFLVPRDTPGFRVVRVIPKLGCRGHRLSEIRLENCRIPAENLLGAEGMGLEYVKRMLTCGRITIASLGVGIARAAYGRALSYSRSRQAFGAPISSFQLVQEKLADMTVGIRAARLMTLQAAWLKDRGVECAGEAAQAKLLASETALRVCDAAIQIHGGYGYTDECDVHRHWRDARMLTIGEGTSDMLRLLIAHKALKQAEGGT